MARIAIMQGRLLPPENGRFQSFPRERWREEFRLAKEAGLDAIEWIFDLYGEDVNPLLTAGGVDEMHALSREYGIAVESLCADYFMDRPFVTAAPALAGELKHKLQWLINQCATAGIRRIVMPFVDASRIETPAHEDCVVMLLQEIAPLAEQAQAELHLETALPPHPFAELLQKLDSPAFRVNYDSGNSASLGYSPQEELCAYGARIASIHIKDRVRGGGTVPLGEGSADIPVLLKELTNLDYRGDYVLQVARSTEGEEVAWARKNAAWLRCELQRAQSARAGAAH